MSSGTDEVTTTKLGKELIDAAMHGKPTEVCVHMHANPARLNSRIILLQGIMEVLKRIKDGVVWTTAMSQTKVGASGPRDYDVHVL